MVATYYVLPAHLASVKDRYNGGWGKGKGGMIANDFTESASAILRYAKSIGADCTPPKPGR